MTQSQIAPQDSLDYEFLKYIGVSNEGEAAIHGYYLPLLEGCERVLDLGCGFGGFVKMLTEQGIDAYGVDSDPSCIAEAKAQNIPVIEADVVEHLRNLPENSLDAIVSAHVVEHLPYQAVLDTIELSHRALRKGGKLLLITPNPRALISHLELYYMHFGHVAMYHPKLLSFFLTHCHFVNISDGENPLSRADLVAPQSPLRNLASLPILKAHERTVPPPTYNLELKLPPPPEGLVRNLIYRVRTFLVNRLLREYFDQLANETRKVDAYVNAVQADLAGQMLEMRSSMQTTIEAMDRPFESYVIGEKA